jgi:gentisate 1,2-dioxygenase
MPTARGVVVEDLEPAPATQRDELITSPTLVEQLSELDGLRRELAADHLLPLWEIMRNLAANEPRNGGDPILWTWSGLRRHALRAGAVISAAEAERRVIVLDNPAFNGQARATSSLYAGIQLILPGEVAPSHRHTASALRLILEGQGGYTTVDGEQVPMSPGDFIVTPSGVFHDHGNTGTDPVLWLDGLDLFVVNLLNAPFAEDHPDQRQPISRANGDSLARFGSGLLPHGWTRGEAQSPIFWWPYDRTKVAIDTMRSSGTVDDALGLRMNFIDPTTGSSPIRTMTASMTLYPAGFDGVPYRSVSGTVCSVVEGSGQVRVGSQEWTVGPNDVFVLPSWNWHSFRCDQDLIVFSFSDEVLQRHLGFWREERLSRAGV